MLSAIFWLIAIAVLVTTALPITNSVRWWVRMWDFPRVHIAGAALLALLLALPFTLAFKPLLLIVLAACLIYQAVRIYPYMPFAPTEIDLIGGAGGPGGVTLLAANVLMENTRYDDLIAIIQREDPDVLFLMETDAKWYAALGGLLAGYPVVEKHIAGDHYGLIFATRLKSAQTALLWPRDDDTPAIKAALSAPCGTEFNFIGLHPRPPVPGNDTQARDRQIRKAAEMTSSHERPTICMGDFNDVAWSWTTARFKRYGNFLEPRVGRGMIASFDARRRFMRLPIDQLFVTRNVGLVSFGRLECFGSDHFPLKAVVTFDPAPSAGTARDPG